MIEVKHLRTLAMLKQHGSLAKAADALCTSQSALSHQINGLEDKLAKRLYIRKSQPITFTEVGLILVQFAEKMIDELDEIVCSIKPNDKLSRYSLGFACHACFQWLVPITTKLATSNEVNKSEIIFDFHGERFDNSLDLDILFTDDKPSYCQYDYYTLGTFEQVAIVHCEHPLAKLDFVTAKQLSQNLLLTYPLPNEQLDVFRRFLTPANQSVKQVRKVPNSQTILQMVNADMGVTVLPQWLMNSHQGTTNLKALSLGKSGLTKHLYVRVKPALTHHQAIQQLINEAKQEFASLVKTTQVNIGLLEQNITG